MRPAKDVTGSWGSASILAALSAIAPLALSMCDGTAADSQQAAPDSGALRFNDNTDKRRANAASAGDAGTSAVDGVDFVLTPAVTTTNNPPTAVADSATAVAGGAAITVNVLANDTDADGDALSLGAVSASGIVAGSALAYSASFETDLTGWSIWANCAASSGWSGTRYYTASENPAPGGGSWDLRLHTVGFQSGCSNPGVYALSPALGASPGATYTVDNWSRNGGQHGQTVALFFDGGGSQIGYTAQSWGADSWVFNADATMTVVAPAGTATMRVRYQLLDANAYADMDLLSVSSVVISGFNWWPYTPDTLPSNWNACNVLWPANWTTSNKARIAAELDHMASLGAGVLRLMFWPDGSGWNVPCGGASTFVPTQYVDANLPALLDMIGARKMKVIVALGNNRLDRWDCNNKQGGYWKDSPSYGDSNTGFGLFLADSKVWADRILAKVNHPAVLYVDLQNEVDTVYGVRGGTWHPGELESWYAQYALQWFSYPDESKIGFSLMRDDDAVGVNAAAVAAGKTLRFADFHVYPGQNDDNNDVAGNKQSIIEKLGARLNGPVIVAELGKNIPDPSDQTQEQTQVDNLSTIMNNLANAGVPIGLNWTFYGGLFGGSGCSLGLPPNNPRTSLEWWSSQFSLAPNPSMAGPVATSGTKCTGDGDASQWWPGASGVTHWCETHWGANFSDSAAGVYYGRVEQDSGTSGSMWLCSDTFPAQPGAVLYANSYVRGGSVKNIGLIVNEYTAGGTFSRATTAFGGFTPTEWQFFNLRYAVRGTYPSSTGVKLLSTTASARVCVRADVTGNPAILDIDAVSAFYR